MSDVRIHEQGYRRYEGPRQGILAATASTAILTLRYILGLRRRARAKLVPWGIAAFSYLPAVGFVAITAFVPDLLRDVVEEALPGPEAYLGGIILLVYLAAAVAGPSALCGDRRHGALALYLSSQLSRTTYLVAKAGAVLAFVALVTVVPPLIYVLGTVLAGAGPAGWVAVLRTVGRVVLAGSALALLFGGLSLAAASLTTRLAAAAGAVVLYVILSATIVNVTVFELDVPTGLLLVDINQVASGVVQASYGYDAPGGLPAGAVWPAWAAWVALLLAGTWLRYRRLMITR